MGVSMFPKGGICSRRPPGRFRKPVCGGGSRARPISRQTDCSVCNLPGPFLRKASLSSGIGAGTSVCVAAKVLFPNDFDWSLLHSPMAKNVRQFPAMRTGCQIHAIVRVTGFMPAYNTCKSGYRMQSKHHYLHTCLYVCTIVTHSISFNRAVDLLRSVRPAGLPPQA